MNRNRVLREVQQQIDMAKREGREHVAVRLSPDESHVIRAQVEEEVARHLERGRAL